MVLQVRGPHGQALVRGVEVSLLRPGKATPHPPVIVLHTPSQPQKWVPHPCAAWVGKQARTPATTKPTPRQTTTAPRATSEPHAAPQVPCCVEQPCGIVSINENQPAPRLETISASLRFFSHFSAFSLYYSSKGLAHSDLSHACPVISNDLSARAHAHHRR